MLLTGILGVIVSPETMVGVSCAPATSGTCNAQPVCCANNNFNGLIAIDCAPREWIIGDLSLVMILIAVIVNIGL